MAIRIPFDSSTDEEEEIKKEFEKSIGSLKDEVKYSVGFKKTGSIKKPYINIVAPYKILKSIIKKHDSTKNVEDFLIERIDYEA